MNRHFRRTIGIASLLALQLAAAPLADFSALDREFGSGANRIALVVDWNDNTPDDSVTWGLNYDAAPGDGTVAAVLQEMMNPISDLYDDTFAVTFTDFGGSLGLFVDSISVTGPEPHSQDRMGGFAETFALWDGPAAGMTWNSTNTGISSTPIVPEQAYGFSWGAFPQDPPNFQPAAIPEPSSLGLLGIGAVLVLRYRRTR